MVPLKQLNPKQKKEGWFLPAMMTPLAALLIAPMACSLINGITGKGVKRAEKIQEGRFLQHLALSLMKGILERES